MRAVEFLFGKMKIFSKIHRLLIILKATAMYILRR